MQTIRVCPVFCKRSFVMTRFVGDAICHRQGRARGETGASRKKKLEDFMATGKHEDIEMAQRAAQERIPELPEHDQSRPFVFIDMDIAGKPAGRLVIELFDDVIPTAAAHFRNRCMPGSRIGIAGVAVNKLVPFYAVFLGKNAAASEGTKFKPVSKLRSTMPGCVAVSLNGDQVAISLAPALALDTSGYQVVGRVYGSHTVIDALNDVAVGPDSAPYVKVAVSRTGPTNAHGDHEELGGPSGNMTTADAVARLKQESATARSAVMEALQMGLGAPTAGDTSGGSAGGKRKADDSARPSGCGQGQEAPAGKRATAERGSSEAKQASSGPDARKAGAGKSKALDALLGDLTDDDSDLSES